MFFNNRTFTETTSHPSPFCQKHTSYSLDQICLNPKCKMCGRLCILCSYELHRGHQIMPFQVFVEQTKEAWHKDKEENENILEDCFISLDNLKKKLSSVKKGIEDKINALFVEIEEEIERKHQIILDIKKIEGCLAEGLKMLDECASNNVLTLDYVPKILDRLKVENMEIVGVCKNDEKIKIMKESINNLENQFDKDIWTAVWRLEQDMADIPITKDKSKEERKEGDWNLRKNHKPGLISA